MKVFFDTEFTGLVPNTTLISIGLISDTNKKFYAEFTDYDKSLCGSWIRENVIKNMSMIEPGTITEYEQKRLEILSSVHGDISGLKKQYFKPWAIELMDDPDSVFIYGSSWKIARTLKKWFEEINKDNELIELVSDVDHYDMTLLCNLFGGAFSLPKNVVPACYDICQDLSDNCNMREAFDYSREEACKYYNEGRLPEGEKHNALYDAKVIKMIFEGMKGIKNG